MFKVGDKVKISEALRLGEVVNHCFVSNGMMKYAGHTTKVNSTYYSCGAKRYILDIDVKYSWIEEYLEEVKEVEEIKEESSVEVNEIKVGDRVKIVKNTIKSVGAIADREKFIGQIGIVKDTMKKSYTFPNHKFMLEFEDSEMQMKNIKAGTWLWSADELEIDRNRVVIGENCRTIYSYPAIIHIIYEGKKQYKGISKCDAEDVYDEEKGLEIAILKAEIKQKEYRLKKLQK